MNARRRSQPDDLPTASLGSTSQTVLNRVKLGSAEDQRLLIALYSPLVINIYINKTIVEELAQREEIRNIVFATVFRKIEKDGFSRQGRGAFRSWLKTITRNKVGDFIRRRRRREAKETGLTHQLDFLAESSAPVADEGDDAEIEEITLVRQAMEVVRTEVEATTYEMARLQMVEGVAAAAAANACGKTANAAYVAKHRVKRRLRELLARFESWDEAEGRSGEHTGEPS
jgi:RNA polymerase sigma-70 factor, ECF subfamily